VHIFENNAFFRKTMGFLSNVLDTTSNMIYFVYKAYAFYQNKNYLCFSLFSYLFGQLRIQTYNSLKLSDIQPFFLEI